MIKYTTLLFLFSALYFTSFCQQDLEKQIVRDPVFTADIVDDIYGITYYEPLNLALNGDSTRMKQGYAVNGWIEDFYQSGQKIHRGFYIDGQLKIYKNYYPNGNVEREFTNIDNFRSKATLYYDNGNIKSQVKYIEGYPKLWIDYYKNGKMEYYEEYHRGLVYHIAKRSFYENGEPSSLFELTSKKKLTYSLEEYYKDGGIKLKGHLRYNKQNFDYQREGTWIYYNEDGSEEKEEKYKDGKLVK